VVSQRSLFAIWKIQSTKATARVFFKPGKTGLRASQKLILRDLVDSLEGANQISISLAATRSRSDAKKIGKARNTAVVRYLKSLGVEATFTRTNKFGASRVATSKKNNRVTIQAGWTNGS
jgi:outer membrane protein OmpA-like peptidoglycan-associated protein